jgi:enoyl-CoA hydratase/carnithine racemase
MAIDYEREGKIAVFTLNRPEALNAMDPSSVAQLSRALTDFRDDDEVWVGIITGAGDRAFSAGADLKGTQGSRQAQRGKPWLMPATIMRGLELWKPLIAAVNGLAFGGGLEIVLACDLRIAAENATFGLPEVRLGLIPGWGGTQRLPRAIPKVKAAELLFTGRPIDAEEAYRIGLVNKVVPLAELMPAAREMAETICESGPLAVRAAKQAMIQGASLSLEQGLRLEAMLQDFLFTTEDLGEGIKAFREKRKPIFKAK